MAIKRLYEPKKINYDGTEAFIESLVKSGEFVQSHKYYSSDREKAQAYISLLSNKYDKTRSYQ